MKNHVLLLCRTLVPLLFLFVTACNQAKPEAGKSSAGPAKKPPPKPIPVAVAALEVGDIASLYATTASLYPEHYAQVQARISGMVTAMLAEEGDRVEEGQVLLTVEEEQQKLDLVQAELEQKRLQREFDRLSNMNQAGVLAPQDFEKVASDLERAKSQVDEARLMLSYTQVRAPFSGRIVRRHLDRGAHIQAGAALFDIMDVDPLLLRVHVPANRLGSVAVGQELNLRLDSSGRELVGVVSLISPIVDRETGTIKVTAEIHQYPADTRPGDFTEVQLVTALHTNTLLVPSEAVIEEQGRNHVYVADGTKAVKRQVDIGFVEGGLTEITSGLERDELIVVKGQRNLREDSVLEILEGPGVQSTKTVDTHAEAAL